MSIEIFVPDIGDDEVAVTEILVKVGDSVEADQSLLTVEGDKASMEVPSPQAGVVTAIKVALGDKVSTGSLIMAFEVAGGAVAASSPAPEVAAPAAAAVAASAEQQVADIEQVGQRAGPAPGVIADAVDLVGTFTAGTGRDGLWVLGIEGFHHLTDDFLVVADR